MCTYNHQTNRILKNELELQSVYCQRNRRMKSIDYNILEFSRILSTFLTRPIIKHSKWLRTNVNL